MVEITTQMMPAALNEGGQKESELQERRAQLHEETASFFFGYSLDEAVDVNGQLSSEVLTKLTELFKKHIALELANRDLLKAHHRDIGAEKIQTMFERALDYLQGNRKTADGFIHAIHYMTEEVMNFSAHQRATQADKLMKRWGGLLSPLLGEEYTLQHISPYHEINGQHRDHVEKANKLSEQLVTCVMNNPR